MGKAKPCVVGMAGFGTVGSGLAHVLHGNRDWLRGRTGRPIELKAVADLHESKREAIEALGAAYVKDARDLIRDPDIDVFVELIGGIGVARDLIREALAAGKHVVTANKALLAEHGQELFALAADRGRHLGYEASVAGGVPIIHALRESLAGNRIESLMGILNGTVNFILTEMSARGMDFDTALKLAQDKGYAEADPTLDIEGWDSAHKLVLLIRLAFGVHYPLESLPVTGVCVVTPMDIAFAAELGYTIKLLAMARQVDGKIEAGVIPALISRNYLLAKVEGSFNAVRVTGNAVGDVLFYGRGAGDRPTGSAVLGDIMAIARDTAPNNTGFQAQSLPAANMLDLEDAVSLHYLRFIVSDRVGVMHALTGALAQNNISIAQAVQKGEDEGHGVPIVFLTHEAPARNIHAAMRDVEKLGLTLGRAMHYRIL